MKLVLPRRENTGIFMAASENLDTAKGVILGVPLDDTASFRPGSRFGPAAVRQVSRALEEYSLYLDRSLQTLSFADGGDLVLAPGCTQGSRESIASATSALVGAGKIPFLLGGEHTITLAAVEGCLECLDSLTVLYLDAHADLRPSYLELPLSHASVAYHLQRLPGVTVFEVGIRSADGDELAHLNSDHFFPFTLYEPLKQLIPLLKGKPLYITLDLDVVDPAFAPGVGAPEPGGITSGELLRIFPLLEPLREQVVAFDLVEICPPYDHASVTALLGAKVLREALLAFLK